MILFLVDMIKLSYHYHFLFYILSIYIDLLSFFIACDILGAIKYLESIGERVNIINVADIVGCHPSIHKGFNKIYRKIFKIGYNYAKK